MGSHLQSTPLEWFQVAVRCYIENHQGCATCGRQHCVFQYHWGPGTEYYCSGCDFSVCHDRRLGQYFVTHGDGRSPAENLLEQLARERDGHLVAQYTGRDCA
jgi:hypothetical protein